MFVAEFHIDLASGAATAAKNIRISDGGGFAPRWRADGRELFYLKPDGAVMSIEIGATHQILTTAANRLFAVPGVITVPRLVRFEAGSAFSREGRLRCAVTLLYLILRLPVDVAASGGSDPT